MSTLLSLDALLRLAGQAFPPEQLKEFQQNLKGVHDICRELENVVTDAGPLLALAGNHDVDTPAVPSGRFAGFYNLLSAQPLGERAAIRAEVRKAIESELGADLADTLIETAQPLEVLRHS